MIDTLMEMFSYTFLVRAVVVGLLVSLCAALLGVSLVLKRYSMIGDGLSHVGFGSLAIATVVNAAPLTVSIPVVVLAAFLLLRISENSKIKGDAAIALISTSSLAIGVVVISLTTGMNTDVCNYMFGSILAMSKDDVALSIVLAAAVLGLFILFYNKIFAVTFDENFAKATGVKTGLYNMLIAFLTAITIVLGMRMMGALLISSLIIFPALTSMRLCKKFKSVTICSAFVSVICFFVGVVISYIKATPTGASVVLVNIVVFLLFWAVNILKGRSCFMKNIFVLLSVCLILLTGCNSNRPSANLPPKNNNGTQAISTPDNNQRQTTPSSPSSSSDTTTKDSESGGQMGVPSLSDSGSSIGTTHDTPVEAPLSDLVVIKEKMFIAQTNDIYYNAEDYLGKTIKYEGIFDVYEIPESGEKYYSVIRYGPGCCGIDANAGFEVTWDNDYPTPNDWVEAVGVLEEYEEDGWHYLRLSLSSLTVLPTRGAEYVSQ
jgi:zinc transport system permease protein